MRPQEIPATTATRAMAQASPTLLTILAPISGVLVPLESVPDPVFAQKMVGDGVSIDPTCGELVAPVTGIVTQLHPAHHALTITSDEGLEILLHIGIDTVMMKGEGFTPHVAQGDRVSVGQLLISFDADKVACRAPSLLTQVLVANVEKVARFLPASGAMVAGESTALTLELEFTPPAAASVAAGGGALTGEPVALPNPAGLHARPAAVLAAEAKKFKADVRLVRDAQEVNAKSVVAIMGLSTKQGDLIRVKASGPDAGEALRAVSALIAAGCGEKAGDAPAVAEKQASAAVAAPARPLAANELAGVSASPGLAVGRVVQFRQATIEVAELGGPPAGERRKLDEARHQARLQIDALKSELADPLRAQILDAHQELLDDPDLIDLALKGIDAGKSAGFAWREAFSDYARQLESLDNPLLRERGNDIRDVGRRVLALLAGVTTAQVVMPEGSILIAEELSPSDTAALDRSKVLGFCTTTGGATSHVAILARSLGIPAVCGIDERALTLENGSLVVLDGAKGLLQRDPDAAAVAAAEAGVARQAARRADELASAADAAITSDGTRIEVMANVRNAQEAAEGIGNGGEGVGLLRSEFLFDERESAPDEEEQAAAYCAVATALGPQRPLIVRTLDVGGDKPLPYLPLPREDNPFLGLRGVRVSLDQPQMFRTQLRAILRAAPLTRLHIMFPMIATLDELLEAKALLAQEQAAMGVASVSVGIMVEVPSVAVMAEQFAREVDFFSIGTNDLTQYTLAMDRGHPKLAKKADALNPAVLKMIQLTCAGASAQGKWVGVCGGMASDPMAVPVLLGLGVGELSVSVPAIPAIKALIKRVSLAECRELAAEVLQMRSSTEVRARLAPFAD